MNNDDLDLVRGSGNVFRDLGHPEADLEQLRALLAAEIIKTLDYRQLSVRDAEAVTGVPYADFSRIRNVKLDRFTIDKLMKILSKLDQEVWVKLEVRPREDALQAIPA